MAQPRTGPVRCPLVWALLATSHARVLHHLRSAFPTWAIFPAPLAPTFASHSLQCVQCPLGPGNRAVRRGDGTQEEAACVIAYAAPVRVIAYAARRSTRAMAVVVTVENSNPTGESEHHCAGLPGASSGPPWTDTDDALAWSPLPLSYRLTRVNGWI